MVGDKIREEILYREGLAMGRKPALSLTGFGNSSAVSHSIHPAT